MMTITFSRADLRRLAEIVRTETGNEVLERNYSMIESRMRSRLMQLGLQSLERYWSYFSDHEAEEREAIKSLLTTHHTFFFREFAHFEAIEVWLAVNEQKIKNEGRPLRVWSAACSRGQEAYSLAMFLEDHAVSRRGINYQILGTDIDSESIAYAQNGVYPLNEVYSIPANYLSQHWKKGSGAIKDFAAIKKELKSKLQFQSLNLLSFQDYPKTNFDLIFCRNVFIYFSPENVAQIATKLSQNLSSHGLFVSGVSEPLRFTGWDFVSVGPSCYQRPSAQKENLSPHPQNIDLHQNVRPLRSESSSEAPTIPSSGIHQPPQSSARDHAGEKYRVLCVDDSPTIQKLMKKIFSQDPLCKAVDLANNGLEARKCLDQTKYQLITLDIHMPVVSGIEFLERLYQRKVDPPVLMISSVNRTDKDLATKSLGLGAFDYVEKPSMNQLDQSAGEIMIKAKMAMRSFDSGIDPMRRLNFDQSIAQQIVVPDASQSLRLLVGDQNSKDLVEHILKAEELELRSPPLAIIVSSNEDRRFFEKICLEISSRKVSHLKQPQLLKPMHHYLIESFDVDGLFANAHFKNLSIQILARKPTNLPKVASSRTQYLLDETLLAKQTELEQVLRIRFNEVAPATSFCSLSLEFFTGAQRAVAS